MPPNTSPGAGFLAPQNNLSDLQNPATARANLGIGKSVFGSRRQCCVINNNWGTLGNVSNGADTAQTARRLNLSPVLMGILFK